MPGLVIVIDRGVGKVMETDEGQDKQNQNAGSVEKPTPPLLHAPYVLPCVSQLPPYANMTELHRSGHGLGKLAAEVLPDAPGRRERAVLDGLGVGGTMAHEHGRLEAKQGGTSVAVAG